MHALAALTWDPYVRGWLIVLLAVLLLPGTVYMVLSTNLGSRLGFLVAIAGLMGWMTLMGVIWTVYGIGLKGDAPLWVVQGGAIQGQISEAPNPVLAAFPRGWHPLKLDNPETTEAQSIADEILAPAAGSGKKGLFTSTSDYLTVGAFDKGGEKYLPGWEHPPPILGLKHKPHYLVVVVKRAIKPVVVPGQTPPKSQPDQSAPPVAVLMERNLGSLRVPAAQITVCSAVLFGVLCYMLHRRDREAMARRTAASS